MTTDQLPVGLDAFTEAVIEKIRTIPGVLLAEQVDGQPPGLIGVRLDLPVDDWMFVQVSH